MYIDRLFTFGLPTIANSTTLTVSSNVYDAGSARIIFGASMGRLALWTRPTITADASPSFSVDLVGSDNADGDVNDDETVGNIIIASSGIRTKETQGDLSALDSGDTIEVVVPLAVQTIAKRYYMLLVKLGGTNPDLAAGQEAYVVPSAQTHMIGARAAVPA